MPYTCDAGLDGGFDATLAQVGDDGSVNPSGASIELRCTAQNRTGVLAFHAYGAAWRTGKAFVRVTGYACGDDSCSLAYAFRTLRLA